MGARVNSGAVTPYGDRTFIILNPVAGQESPNRLRRLLGGAFAVRHAPFDLVETQHTGHATELARTAAEKGYRAVCIVGGDGTLAERSEEHTSELQSRGHLVCRLLLEKKKL